VIGFWAGSAIAVKAAVRGQPWRAIMLLSFVYAQLDKVRRLVGTENAAPGAEPATAPPVQPAAQLALLRAMGREMEALMPQVEELGGCVPWETVPQMYRFLDLAGILIGEQRTGNAEP
jgi:hypothetical protein